jgi:N6-adenosine-specific RNA methylase IME4
MTRRAELKFHPLADIFPLIEGAEFDELIADIKANGLLEPIVVYEEMILDGRNRYRACLAAGVEPTLTPFRGDDPVAFVISANLRRRHLDESQRAMVAAKLATLKDGQRGDLVQGLPIGRASELLNVGERSVARARDVQDHGVPELIHAVEQGSVSVSAAADVATLPKCEQIEVVAKGERDILEAAKTIRARKAEQRRAERIGRLLAATKQNAPFPCERYPVIYADPPWHFEVYNEESGVERAAGNHYPTLRLEQICALPVSELATNAAVLFLWTTLPHLEEALQVVAAWGFAYKSNVVWVKDKIGLGYLVRNQHELLLIATRGDIPTPLPAQRPASVINAPRREHSRKPDEACALIERMYPNLPKIELFARNAREGWAAWGNQAPAANNDDWGESKRGRICGSLAPTNL